MNNWEKFEKECTQYLNNIFGSYAFFHHIGGTDSTKPDIEVKTKLGKIFYIEIKHCPAQSGQFVLLPDNSANKFIYSSLNANPINIYTNKIIDFMNNNFEKFKLAGTKGENINIIKGSQIFASWIIKIYKEKNIRFFITNDFKIIDIDNFMDYFNVSAKYRIKRSGSSSVGKNNMSKIIKYIKENYQDISYLEEKENKLFISSKKNLNGNRFLYEGNEYMISARNTIYEVRKLSKTYNANVIFSIDVKNNKPGMSNNEFIDYLNKYR